MKNRSTLEECWPEPTPLGWGVRVGDVTWTRYGQGRWSDDLTASERHERVAALIESGETPIYLGGFMLLPGEAFTMQGEPFICTLFGKAV